jgi:1-acyl-sn-glycerol-3-phosphate acyltransferase
LARLGAQSAWARALRAGAAAADLAWSAWAWIVFGLVGAACWLAVLIAPTPRARRRAVRVLARSGWRLLGVPIDVRGLERLPRERCIVVANHASYADSVLLTAVLPARFVFTAKEELARAPVFGWPLRRIGTGFVARSADERGREDTRALQVRVESGESLIFYPEGTLQRAPGLLPFKLGAFAVAAATGAAVVPVAFGGTRSLLRAGRWRPQRHRVAVAIGAAIAPAGDDWAAAIATRDAARHALLALTGEPDLGAEYGPQRRVAASTPGNGHDDDR